jgi:hypothetical protein
VLQCAHSSHARSWLLLQQKEQGGCRLLWLGHNHVPAGGGGPGRVACQGLGVCGTRSATSLPSPPSGQAATAAAGTASSVTSAPAASNAFAHVAKAPELVQVALLPISPRPIHKVLSSNSQQYRTHGKREAEKQGDLRKGTNHTMCGNEYESEGF